MLAAPSGVPAVPQLPWFKILQHGSTILGLALVAAWAWRWLDSQPPAARRYDPGADRRAVRVAVRLAALVIFGLFRRVARLGAGISSR